MHKIRLGIFCAFFSAAWPVIASTPPGPEAAVPVAGLAVGTTVATVVPKNTKIMLMVLNEVTTRTAKPGDTFVILLDRPVIIGNEVVIPAGLHGVAEVTSAKGSGGLGKSGKLVTRPLYLEYRGTRIGLAGEIRNAGAGGTDQVVLASLALTPWGLFARGNNGKLKAGEIVEAVIAEDYVPASAAQALAAPPP